GKLWIGSVKFTTGHLELAAGLVGVIKAALTLRHNMIPSTRGSTEPDARMRFTDVPIAIADRNVPWPSTETPRRIAVNSFGIGGALAQVIVEDLPAPTVSAPVPQPLAVPVSAATSPALMSLAGRLGAALASSRPSLEAVAWTLQSGRAALSERRI